MAETCHNCDLKMAGYLRVYRGGAILSRCMRCGYEQPTIPIIHSMSALRNKYAGMWDVMKAGLTSIAPAVAAVGIWDVAVAYETFKKVMENSLAQQSALSTNPLYAAVKKTVATLKLTRRLHTTKKYANGLEYLGWDSWLSFFRYQEQDFYRTAELEPIWLKLVPNYVELGVEAAVRKTEEIFDSGKIADYAVGLVDKAGGPQKAIEAGILKSVTAVVKKADIADMPSEFTPEEDADQDELFKVNFAALLDLMKQVIPAVVAHTIKTKDDTALRGLGRLVGVMKQFAASHRNAINRFPGEYDHTTAPHSYMGEGQPAFRQDLFS